MVVIQILYSYFQVGTPLTLLNGVVKQVDVRVERELVHRIYLAHIIQDEEQDRGSLCTWSVTLVTKYEPDYVLLFFSIMMSRLSVQGTALKIRSSLGRWSLRLGTNSG